MKRSVTSMHILFMLILSTALFSLGSCKKSDDNPAAATDTFISFKADGVQKTYTVAGYNLFMEGSTYVCNINASARDAQLGESINVLAKSQSAITKKTYGNDNGGSTIQYHPSNGVVYIVVNSDVLITVDKFENDMIEGTFSGTIPKTSGTIKITEGIFKCKPRS